MKFDMGTNTLTTLVSQTQGQSQDLGSLIQALVVAAQPLENKFNGAGKQAFDAFKSHTDQITRNLNTALSSIIGGQSGMNRSFTEGQSEFSQNARSAMGSANFSAASFGRSN
ncbi:hypothetical protein [Jatrophihabitans fulvus]